MKNETHNSTLKLLAKDTAIYGISSIVGRFLNWLLVPMYVRVLSNTGEYGVVTNLYGWTALLLVILTYGMETGLFRFINNHDHPVKVYATTLYSIAATSLLFLIALVSLNTDITDWMGYGEHPEYVLMMGAIVAIDAFTCIPFAYLRYKKLPLKFATVKLVNIAANIVLNIFFLVLCPIINQYQPDLISWFYVENYGVGYIFVANVVTSVLTLLLLAPHFVTALKTKPDLQLLKKLLRYSAPILVLGIAGIFNQTADKILFPFLFDDKNIADQQLGIYGACFKIAVVMVMFIQAFRYAYEPIVFANAQQDNKHEAYAAAMKYFIIFALLIFTGIAFSLDILKLLVQPDYYPGLKVVPIIMVGEIFFGVYFNLSVWYKLTDKTTWGAVFSIIGSVVTVAIIITAVPTYGFIACAYASLISNIIMTSLSYVVGHKIMPVKYDIKSAATYSIITGAVYTLGMFPTIPNVTLRLAYRAALWIAFAAFTVYREQAHLHLPIRKLLHLSKK